VHAPSPVHDVLLVNGSWHVPHTSSKLYLALTHRQKMVKTQGTLLVRNTKESKFYSTTKLNLK
jgi:hypothetical protein